MIIRFKLARRQKVAPAAQHGVRWGPTWWSPIYFALFTLSCITPLGAAPTNTEEIITVRQTGTLRTKEGDVRYRKLSEAETPARVPQSLDYGDTLHTLDLARASGHFSDWTSFTLRPRSLLKIEMKPDGAGTPNLKLESGAIYLSSRGGARPITVSTPHVTGTPRGTEYLVSVESTQTVVTMFHGEVELDDGRNKAMVRSGSEGVAIPNQGISVRPILKGRNVVQWWIYYPAVLDPAELDLSQAEQSQLASSLEACRRGDLLSALRNYPGYPNPETPGSSAGRVYLAGLLLAVGAIDRTETLLNSISPANPQAEALRVMITAVSGASDSSHVPGSKTNLTASQWLAVSYEFQARHDLPKALAAARSAVARSPGFSFGWARVAELEFSFGRIGPACEAVRQALALAPDNPEAHALNGFLLAAGNRMREALTAFDRAITIDPALANAWLGRGLSNRRLGWLASSGASDWLEDIQTAAALEPGRSLLRSYAGKAFTEVGDFIRGGKELKLASEQDPNDPTPWLYSALLKQQENRINEGVRDLEESQALNDNRALFRSKLLLDQDKAVRSANLASMYRDAGMSEVGSREAARAVTYDYANYSAHLFLSDSFNELRDPTRFNLRQETVWFNELLLANLLAPVGAGRLSQTVSANEYSKLFESDGLGLTSQTSWRSDDQFRQLASQYGTFGNTSWALDLDYQHNAGVRPNNELDRLEWYTTFKRQLTPHDTLLLLAKYQDYSSGDNFQYYNPAASYRPNFKFEEQQEPILIGGFQHEWTPGIRTLLLGGRLVNEQQFSDVQAPQLLLIEDGSGAVVATDSQPFDVQLTDDLEIYTAELNQIFQQDRFTVVAGALWQGGEFDFANALTNSPLPEFFLPPVTASFSEPYERFKAYGYLTVEPVEKLWLTAGVAYDQIQMPSNFRSPPQSAGTENRDLVEPKAAIVWSPLEQATLRGIYSKSLGGVSLDESYRLEPTQLAGFAQSYRTVISESIVGSVAAPETEVMGLALDLKLGRGTFAGLQAERICSNVERSIGVYRLDNSIAPFAPGTTRELLDYEEQTFSVSVNQLLGDGFSLGVNYRLTKAQLVTTLPEIPTAVLASASRDESAYLHQLGGYLLYNHPSGFFARFDARFYQQSNHGYTPDQYGDEFVQLDLQAGYRFFQRRAELAVGVLNLTDQDYRLNPLTSYAELPRERVFTTRFSFRF